MKYTEVGRTDNDFGSEDGIHGWVTDKVVGGTPFGDAIRRLVANETENDWWTGDILITVREHWSGYSEYTITNEWSEVILTAPHIQWEQEWPSMGDFLRAVADANPSKEGS